jgi:glycosyltransferase involved in cell wall biosynthesis
MGAVDAAGSNAVLTAPRSPKPFALVLGRKALGKRYPLVLEASQAAEGAFEVVMIGPDDDGLEIRQPGVHCYGPQPRSFVLGALAACACLVNMSESESFGIVLLEAWAAGRPVVAQRRCVAFAELVDEGANGFLVETAAEIRSRVEGYITDPGLAARHAAAGKERALEHAWSALAVRVRQILARDVLAIESGGASPGRCP